LPRLPPFNDSMNDSSEADGSHHPDLTSATEEIKRLKVDLSNLRKQVESKEKDGWDKAGIIAQIASGTIFAALTVTVAWYANSKDIGEKKAELELTKLQSAHTVAHDDAELALSIKQDSNQYKLQREHEEAEDDLENRKIFMDFQDRLSKADSQGQIDLLDEMEMMLSPTQVAEFTFKKVRVPYALEDHPPYDSVDIEQQKRDNFRFNQAILMAGHLKGTSAFILKAMNPSGDFQKGEVIKGILGERTDVYIRTSDIDDFGAVTLNGRPLFPEQKFGEDSGWVRINDRLKVGDNDLVFLVTNGLYGGFGGRLRISAGLQQYDTGPYADPNCPCNKQAFKIEAHMTVNADRSLQLKTPVFSKFPP
jgi:hypothetical protein